jgi:hypothetical protein
MYFSTRQGKAVSTSVPYPVLSEGKNPEGMEQGIFLYYYILQ